MIGVPARLIFVLLPMTIATASIGLYSLASTLAWGWLIFDLPLDLAHPVWFVDRASRGDLRARACSGSFSPRPSCSCVTRTRSRTSSSTRSGSSPGYSSALSLLPGWTRPISYVLAPTWGIRAMREAALGGAPAIPVAICLGLAAVYLVIGHFTLGYFEVRARRSATLALR